MYQCSRCGGYVDAGELHSGICDDCIIEEQQLQLRKEQNHKMLSSQMCESDNGQMILNL